MSLSVGIQGGEAMTVMCAAKAFGGIAAAALLVAAAPPPGDVDTSAWWDIITVLSSDAMRGRDTGSPEHRAAAADVAARFKAAGLQPLGDAGGFVQSVPLHEVRVETTGTRFAIVAPGGRARPLRFLQDVSIRATNGLPAALDTAMVFRGYCGKDDVGGDVAGKLVVCFGGGRGSMVGADERLAAIGAATAAGALVIDDVGFTVEPPQWPAAYARSVTLRSADTPKAPALALMRLNPAALPLVLKGSGHDAAAVLATAIAARPLPGFDLPGRFRADLVVSERDFSSENIIALLPGTDAALAKEAIVVDAHLDGYEIGTPMNGDAIYNGAFDDAAYVASLVRLAQIRQGKGFRRPVIFAVFTGEEKGLLG